MRKKIYKAGGNKKSCSYGVIIPFTWWELLGCNPNELGKTSIELSFDYSGRKIIISNPQAIEETL